MSKPMVQRFWFIMVLLLLCFQMRQGIIVIGKAGSSQKTREKEKEREMGGLVTSPPRGPASSS